MKKNFSFLPHINLLLCFPIPHYHSSALEDMRNTEVYKKLQKLQIFISDHPDVEKNKNEIYIKNILTGNKSCHVIQ